jgi:hypothetical protein
VPSRYSCEDFGRRVPDLAAPFLVWARIRIATYNLLPKVLSVSALQPHHRKKRVCHNSDHQCSIFVETTAMKQSFEVKPKRASLASPFSIHFEARLKPLGWSSPIDLCAAGGKNPGFGLLAAVYASKNQVSLPQFRRFELAVLPLESPTMKAQTSSIGHLIQSYSHRWKELTELSPQSTL